MIGEPISITMKYKIKWIFNYDASNRFRFKSGYLFDLKALINGWGGFGSFDFDAEYRATKFNIIDAIYGRNFGNQNKEYLNCYGFYIKVEE